MEINFCAAIDTCHTTSLVWWHGNGKSQIYLHVCDYYLNFWNLSLDFFCEYRHKFRNSQIVIYWYVHGKYWQKCIVFYDDSRHIIFRVCLWLIQILEKRSYIIIWLIIDIYRHIIDYRLNAVMVFKFVYYLLKRFFDMVWICKEIFTVIYT